MSEEEVTEENIEVQTPEEGGEEESSNPIFDALFKAVESEDTDEEEQEEFTPPSSLQSALHDIEQGIDSEETPEATQEAPEQGSLTQEVEPKKKKKRVARKKEIVDPDFSPVETRSAPPPRQNADTSGLNIHEKSRYELAQWASQNVKGYQGKDAQYLKFFNDHKKYLQTRISEDPDIELENDESYRKFLAQNRPEFDTDFIKNSQLKKDAERSAIEKLTPEIENQKRELTRLKNQPLATKAKADSRKLVAQAVPKEIMEGFRKNPNFSTTHALEAKIVDRVLGEANAMVEAFHDIANDIEDYNSNNPIHAQLAKWIDNEQTSFINSGKTKRQGKTFVRRERFPHVPASEQSKYYTFSDEDMVRILAQRAGSSMKDQINNSLKQLEESGFTRGSVSQKPQSVPQSTQRITPSPRPGPSVESAHQNPSENKVLSLLGL